MCMAVNESLNISRMIEAPLLSSLSTLLGDAPRGFLHRIPAIQRFCKSLSSSATFLPSATVRMITPNFSLMLL